MKTEDIWRLIGDSANVTVYLQEAWEASKRGGPAGDTKVPLIEAGERAMNVADAIRQGLGWSGSSS